MHLKPIIADQRNEIARLQVQVLVGRRTREHRTETHPTYSMHDLELLRWFGSHKSLGFLSPLFCSDFLSAFSSSLLCSSLLSVSICCARIAMARLFALRLCRRRSASTSSNNKLTRPTKVGTPSSNVNQSINPSLLHPFFHSFIHPSVLSCFAVVVHHLPSLCGCVRFCAYPLYFMQRAIFFVFCVRSGHGSVHGHSPSFLSFCLLMQSATCFGFFFALHLFPLLFLLFSSYCCFFSASLSVCSSPECDLLRLLCEGWIQQQPGHSCSYSSSSSFFHCSSFLSSYSYSCVSHFFCLFSYVSFMQRVIFFPLHDLPLFVFSLVDV